MKLVQSTKRPCDCAVLEADGIWLVTDDAARLDAGAVALTSTAARDAVPLRSDLPKDHPLYGKRALRCVLSGSPDVVVTDAGVVTTDLSLVAEVIHD